MRPVAAARAALAVVLLGAVFAHARGLAGGFVYDDHRFVERNDAISTLASPQRFFLDPDTASAAQGVEADVWRPLRTIHFALDRALFGLDARGWHAANVALHAVNAALVFLLLLRLLARRDDGPHPAGASAPWGPFAAAAAGALLFAVHPVTVESVAWVSSRGDLLAWTFVLLALEAGRRRGVSATLATVALVVLACLAKESAVVAFALLPLHHFALPAAARPSRRETVVRTAALVAATALYFVARAAVMPSKDGLPLFAQTEFPDGSRAAAARGFLAAVAGYAKAILLPTGFPFDRNVYTDPVPVSWLDPSVVLGGGILLATLLGGIVALRRGARNSGTAAFACLGSLAALVPVSNVIVPLKAFAAERFLYPLMPCVAAGFAALVLAVARRFRARGRPAGVVVTAGLVAAALVALGVSADARTKPWHDDVSLWTAVQREEPMNPRAYEGLGFHWLREGRLSKAESALRTYIEFQPFDGKAHALLAAELYGAYRDIARLEGTPEDPSDGSVRLRIPPFLLTKTIDECRTAVRLWSQLGLERARGDRRLLRATLGIWRDAALEYGDLAEARRVSGLLLAEDRADGVPEGRYEQRRMPAILAVIALGLGEQSDPQRDLARRRTRAEMLEAAGLSPELSDAAAYRAVLEPLGALLAERPTDDAVRYDRVEARKAWLRLTQPPMDVARAELRLIHDDLRALVDRRPRDRARREELEQVRRLLGS